MKAIFAQRSKPQSTGRASGTSLALKREAGAIAGTPLFLKRDAAIQAKLTVNPANDAYEQEADRVADHVTSVSNTAPTVQRKCEKCEQEENIQRKPLVNLSIQRQAEPQGLFDRECESSSSESTSVQQKSESSGSIAQPSMARVESTLASKQGNGSPLPDSVKGTMESRMGYDLNYVRIHTDQDAVQLNRTLGAQAFTHGENIFFGAGKFNPHSTAGHHLLAHELTHVIQQTGCIQTKRSPDQPTIQRKCAACEEEQIQRSPDDFLSKFKKVGWDFTLTPKTSTDDSQDTFENRRRAEMQESDKRSNDPTPNEWWKKQNPTMPKPPKGCPTERWNPFWNTCCPEGQHKDPVSPNCVSNSSAPPPLRPVAPPSPKNEIPLPLVVPPAEKGDFPLPDSDQQYA